MSDEVRLKDNIGRLIFLFVGGSVIYYLPYFRSYYYLDLQEAINATDTQMGLIASVFGVFAMLGYLPGGWIADKISPRKLLSVSFILTGLSGFYFATFPSFEMVMALHCLWGITTCTTFWAAYVKANRMIAAANEQGKVFGFMEAGRGITSAVFMSVVLAIFVKMGSSQFALSTTIMIYSGMALALGIVYAIVLRDGEKSKDNTVTFSDIGKVLKLPHVWMIALIIFCSYSLNMAAYYISPYTTAIVGGATALGTAMLIINQYIKPIGAGGAGILGDRLGSSKVILIGFIFMVIGSLSLAFLPQNSSVALLIIVCVIVYVAMFVIMGLSYALMEEGNIPVKVSGTAVGVIATLGYLPEVIIPIIAGNFLDTFSEVQGYRYFFTFIACITAVGFFATLLWLKITKVKRAELKELRLSKKEEGKK